MTPYEDETECTETSKYKIQTPENQPKEKIRHLQHGRNFEINNILVTTNQTECVYFAVRAESLNLIVRMFNGRQRLKLSRIIAVRLTDIYYSQILSNEFPYF